MLRLRALGECVIEVGGARLGPDSERLFAALLYLAFERGRSVARAGLIQLLWPAVPDLDDVRSVALVVLRHRVVVNFQAEAEGIGVERLLPLGERP